MAMPLSFSLPFLNVGTSFILSRWHQSWLNSLLDGLVHLTEEYAAVLSCPRFTQCIHICLDMVFVSCSICWKMKNESTLLDGILITD